MVSALSSSVVRTVKVIALDVFISKGDRNDCLFHCQFAGDECARECVGPVVRPAFLLIGDRRVIVDLDGGGGVLVFFCPPSSFAVLTVGKTT